MKVQRWKEVVYMKKFLKKTSLFLVTAAMTVSAPLMAWALEHDIVILHTNDIHCGINDNIGFAGLAQIKKDALARTPNVALVDAGDAIQAVPWSGSCRYYELPGL
jgi:5'-nucleotidase/UDP-sugar diphosphatase